MWPFYPLSLSLLPLLPTLVIPGKQVPLTMSGDRLRRRVAYQAARLLYEQEERGVHRAKHRAAERLLGESVRPCDLPTRREIREQFIEVHRHHEANGAPDQPHFSLADASKPIAEQSRNRFRVYETLLAPLENVRQNRETHPEGDVLYHSLQVFTLAREKIPYDEEFLLAALLHDVGKAIDPRDHVAAALEALDGFITVRTAWLIEHHAAAQSLKDGTLGARFRRRLTADENYEELMLLADCDRRGRATGAAVADVREALAYLRDLAQEDEA